jgi:hypothetical protein
LEALADVNLLVEEYRSLFGVAAVDSVESLEDLLVHEGDWTLHAASHLLQLAQQYGSFMLRNALALSLALGIEDGDLGF